MRKGVLEASATLVSCTVGAGILGIPYVVEKSGFLVGMIDLSVIALIFYTLNLMLADVSSSHNKMSQLAGYAQEYLGRKGKILMTLTLMFAITGAMTAYLIATGSFLSQIFFNSQNYSLVMSVLFFATMSFLIYLGLEIVERSELYMTIFFISIVLLLFIIALPHINVKNLTQIHASKFLLPYGVLLFAFLGFPALPEAREEAGSERNLRKAILFGTIIPLTLYFLFALTVIGVSGAGTTQSAILSLKPLSYGVTLLGLVFGTLTISTTFLALGLALRDTYYYDFKFSRTNSFLLAVTPPFIIFLSGVRNFTRVLSITGAVAGGLLGILIMMMHSRSESKNKLLSSPILKATIGLLLALGVAYQILMIL